MQYPTVVDLKQLGMFKVDEKLDGTNLMTEHMGKEILEKTRRTAGSLR